MFDDPGKALKSMEQKLQELPPEPVEEPSEPDWDMERQVYFDEDYRQDLRRPRENRKKTGCGQILLALVEVLVIAGVLGWWLLWRK